MTTTHGGAQSADVARLAEAVIADPASVAAVAAERVPAVLAAVVEHRARADAAMLVLAAQFASAARTAEPAGHEALMTARRPVPRRLRRSLHAA